MPYQRDVGDFHARAESYEGGRRGAMHRTIAERTLRLALSVAPQPRRILDVGCGTGYLLGRLRDSLPGSEELAGVDAAPGMVRVAARNLAPDPRVTITQGVAESLPYATAHFDLVVSTTSFDHWQDQPAGLRECARVLGPGGRLVLCDQFSPIMAVTLPFRHWGQARTPRTLRRLLAGAGFKEIRLQPIYASIIRAATAVR